LCSVDEFIYYLKEFTQTVKIDPSVQTDCMTLINHFILALTIFNKFEEIWGLLGVKDR